MNDYCYEELVTKNNGQMGFLFPIFSYTAFTIFAVFFNVVPMFYGLNIIYFTGMISFGIWYLIYRLNKNLKVEYEISIVNDQFTVTSITNGKKREVLADFSIRDADYIGPVTKDRFSTDKEKAAFTLNSTGEREVPINEDVWYILVNGGNYKFIETFNFKGEMYSNFRRYNPRATEFMKNPPKKVEEEESDDE